MKATLIILALATILSVSVTQQASTDTPQPRVIIPTMASRPEATTCPVYVPPAYVEPVTDEVASYKHCVKCNTGVYLPNNENIVRCTFCGASE